MVRSRSLEMAPFDRSHTSFLFTFHSNYGAILSRLRLIGRKSGNLYTPPQPPVFSAPVGVTVGISWRCLMLVKVEWLGYYMVKKLWRYVKPFSSVTGM